MPTTVKTAAILDQFRHLDPEIKVEQMLVFLAVMDRPNISIEELCDVTGIGTSLVARTVASLTKSHRNGQLGLDVLVVSEDVVDDHVSRVGMTAKGKLLTGALFKLLN